jgi:hypothetical protein
MRSCGCTDGTADSAGGEGRARVGLPLI